MAKMAELLAKNWVWGALVALAVFGAMLMLSKDETAEKVVEPTPEFVQKPVGNNPFPNTHSRKRRVQLHKNVKADSPADQKQDEKNSDEYQEYPAEKNVHVAKETMMISPKIKEAIMAGTPEEN